MFIITSSPRKDAPTMVTINNLEALPSYSSWVEYTLFLRIPTVGSLYDVMQVANCRPRAVIKKDVVSFMFMNAMRYNKGLASPEPEEDIKKRVRKTLKGLPDEINSLEDVKREVEEVITLRILLRQLKTRFNKPMFFLLLRYFHEMFLLRLSAEQLRALYALITIKPYIFCFWDSTVRILCQIRAESGAWLFDPERDRLLVDQGYCNHYGKTLLNTIDAPACYSATYPMWSVAKVYYACEDLSLTCAVPLDILRDALTVYLESEKHFINFGNTVADQSKIAKDVEFSQEAIRFLANHAILRPCLGAAKYLTKINVEMVEVRIAINLKRACNEIRLYDCPYYNSHYLSRFSKWLNSGHANAVIVSANIVTASYLGMIGMQVLSADDLSGIENACGKKRPKADSGKALDVVLERFHKFSMGDLDRILSLLVKKEIKANFYLFGDTSDFPAQARKGGGNLMEAFTTTTDVLAETQKWYEWTQQEPMFKIYMSLTKGVGLNLSELHPIPVDTWKQFTEYIKSLEKIKKKELAKDYHIFCSSKEDQALVITQIMLKRLSPTNYKYSPSCFYVGQKVHLLDNDVSGRIEEAYRLVGGSKEKIPTKTHIDLNQGTFSFLINGKEYNSRVHQVAHADAEVIRQFAGKPAPAVIFFVGEKTTRKHLWCAAKYCTSELKIFVKNGVNFSDMQDGSSFGVLSDLASKLSCIGIK
jgi:hypothetical protein